MKSIRIIIPLVVALALSSFSFSQSIKDSLARNSSDQNRTLVFHQKVLKKAKYVFEGIVIKQEIYSNKKGESRTCTVIQIEKIFKGSGLIHLGTIRVITNQGNGLIDGGPAIGNGRYIIVGSPTDSSNLNTPLFDTDNSAIPGVLTLVVIGRDSYLKGKRIHYDTPIHWVGSQIGGGCLYNSIEELYAFFKENGLVVEDEISKSGQKSEQGDSRKH